MTNTRTPRSQEDLDALLAFINLYMHENIIPPTQQEMADHFNVVRATIQNRLAHLVASGDLINYGKRGHVPAARLAHGELVYHGEFGITEPIEEALDFAVLLSFNSQDEMDEFVTLYKSNV